MLDMMWLSVVKISGQPELPPARYPATEPFASRTAQVPSFETPRPRNYVEPGTSYEQLNTYHINNVIGII
jgi:hypothetical protein